MKKTLLLFCLIPFSLCSLSQNQEINGSLTTTNDIFLGKNTPGKIGAGNKIHFSGIDEYTDPVYIYRYNEALNRSTLRVNIGDDRDGDDSFSIGNFYWKNPESWSTWFLVNNLGNVGIGTDAPTQKLDVNGNIKAINFYANGTVFANEVKVEATTWSDFVFDKNYKLLPLEEVKAHIDEYKHLPDVPSEKQVIEGGINIAEMQAKLLQKIEELTLYVIQQDAKNKQLEQEIKELKVSLSKE